MNIPVNLRIKGAVAAVLISLLVVFLVLNTEAIEVNFIIGKLEIRRSVMILTTFFIGLFAGWCLKSFFTVKKKSSD